MHKYLLLAFLLLQSLCGFCIAPTVTSFTPTAAATGMSVVITGTNFTGASTVTFGGTPAASFAVNSATQITAIAGAGSSGIVQVTTVNGPGAKAGFSYVLTSAIITDFGGYWSSTAALPNSVVPDSSHNLLSFTYNGTAYSTGVNDGLLTSKGVTYTAGNFKAFPVAGIAGSVSATSTYLALAKRIDGSAAVANTANVSAFLLKTVLTDGPNGLDLGTGVTNLPATAILSFQISNINPAKINDNEPDVLLTQIAQPVAGNDVFSFVDGGGTVIGNSVTQDMTLLPKFGSYDLDLFNLTPGAPYNVATVFSAFSTATNREIRMVGFKLSDFGITTGNAAQVKALKITPSGNSDYAFIAYNANALNLPPNVSNNDAASATAVCSGGTAVFSIVGTAVAGGTLSYNWQESIDGGTTWGALTETGNYTGTLTSKLSVAAATAGYKYRALVHESGNSNDATGTEFIVSVSAFTAPSQVTVTGGLTTCLNTPLQLTSSVTGGTNLNYQWQTNASGAYVDIAGANLSTFQPSSAQTGIVSYKLKASSGSGCPGAVISLTPAIVTITGIATSTPAARCDAGSVTLNAAATSGTIDWYAADNGGSSLFTGGAFVTPTLAASKTYYVASNGCASALRIPVTATISPLTLGGTVGGGTNVVSGTNNTVLSINGQAGTVVKWQSSVDTFHSVINDINITTFFLPVLNLTANTQYRAQLQSGTCAASFSSTGYMTVSAALPVHAGSFKGSKRDATINLQWTAYDVSQTAYFEIEKSTDGVHFASAAKVQPRAGNDGDGMYNWTDQNPALGNNYYRLTEVLIAGALYSSNTILVNYNNASISFSVYPNPVVGRKLQVQLGNVPAGKYLLQLINMKGQVCWEKKTDNTSLQSFALPSSTSPGTYTVFLSGTGKKMISLIVLP